MSQSPPLQHPQSSPASNTDRYAQTVHNVALAAVVACPVLALLPPRKLDFYTFGLVGTAVYSGNLLVRERSGRSILQHIGGPRRTDAPGLTPSPQEQVNLHRGLLHTRPEMQRLDRGGGGANEELDARTSAREAWKAHREKEIRDDVDEGKGFGEMIVDQIWEVWTWGKKSDDEEGNG